MYVTTPGIKRKKKKGKANREEHEAGMQVKIIWSVLGLFWARVAHGIVKHNTHATEEANEVCKYEEKT